MNSAQPTSGEGKTPSHEDAEAVVFFAIVGCTVAIVIWKFRLFFRFLLVRCMYLALAFMFWRTCRSLSLHLGGPSFVTAVSSSLSQFILALTGAACLIPRQWLFYIIPCAKRTAQKYQRHILITTLVGSGLAVLMSQRLDSEEQISWQNGTLSKQNIVACVFLLLVVAFLKTERAASMLPEWARVGSGILFFGILVFSVNYKAEVGNMLLKSLPATAAQSRRLPLSERRSGPRFRSLWTFGKPLQPPATPTVVAILILAIGWVVAWLIRPSTRYQEKTKCYMFGCTNTASDRRLYCTRHDVPAGVHTSTSTMSTMPKSFKRKSLIPVQAEFGTGHNAFRSSDPNERYACNRCGTTFFHRIEWISHECTSGKCAAQMPRASVVTSLAAGSIKSSSPCNVGRRPSPNTPETSTLKCQSCKFSTKDMSSMLDHNFMHATRNPENAPNLPARSKPATIGMRTEYATCATDGAVSCCETLFSTPQDLSIHHQIHEQVADTSPTEIWKLYKSSKKTEISSSESSRNRYPYTDLNDGQIRLLEIVNDNFGTNLLLKFKVLVARLDEPPPYVALSYFWGVSESAESIQMDSEIIQVSPNLERALRQLVLCGHRRIWTDRLCIWQSNDREKERVIPKMDIIYQQAAEVAAWVGDPDDSSDRIMAALAEGPQTPAKSFLVAFSKLNRWRMGSGMAFSDSDIIAFFQRDYWTRVWIVQEIASAKRLRVYCGSQSVKWDHIRQFLDDAKEDLKWSDVHGPLGKVMRLLQTRREYTQTSTSSLLRVLQRHCDLNATLAHDKVFGMLGLVRDGKGYIPVYSYGKSLRTTCLEITRNIATFSKWGSLDIMLLAQRQQSPLGLPSWCPDYFHVQHMRFNDHLLDYITMTDKKYRVGSTVSKWCTTSEHEEDYASRVETRFDGETLRVAALHVGQVTYVQRKRNEPPPRSGHDRGSFPSHVYVGDSQLYDALSRIFILYHPKYSKWHTRPEVLGFLYNSWIWSGVRWAKNESSFIDQCGNVDVFGKTVRARGRSGTIHKFHNLSSNGVTLDTQSTMWKKDYGSVMEAISEFDKEDLRLMTLSSGDVGWTQKWVQQGDRVCLLQGCSVPVVLRAVEGVTGAGPMYTVAGYAYVDRHMDGRRWMGAVQEARELQTVSIV